MLCSESMIINYTTDEIVQNQNTVAASLKSSATPTKAKVQKVQKKIRKESACSTSTTTTKGTPKQQQQAHQNLQKNKQVVSQLTSPSWSDKTVNLASSTCSTGIPSLTSKNSISSSGAAASSGSLNGQCLANTPQQLHQQTQQQQQSLYQGGSTKKKNQTKISPRSQASSLTSEISSFELCSYNDCVGSSTSSTNHGTMMHNNHCHQQIRSNNSSHPHEILQDAKPINFSPIITPAQEPQHFQHLPLNSLDPYSQNSSPKSAAYYQQNAGHHQHHSQQSASSRNNLNNNMNYNTNNSGYNQGYPTNSPSCNQNSYYQNSANYYDNSTSNGNPASRLINWNVLPAEIQRATYEMNGKIEEVQLHFDSCVPFIEMPHNKKAAFQKVKEAQQLQESLVFRLANVKDGMSLQEAVDNLKDQLLRASGQCASNEGTARNSKASNNSSSINNVVTSTVTAQNSPLIKSASTGAPSKQKKASKKASKQEKISQQSGSPQKATNGSSFAPQNTSEVGQMNGNRQGENGNQYNTAYNSNNAGSNISYNYLPDEEMQNKEVENSSIQPATFQNTHQSARGHNEYGDNSVNPHLPTHGVNPQGMDGYANQGSNKNGMMSPRKPAHSMQGYEEEVMSQQELMNNQVNQYDDFPYQPKLRKYQSDPFGDYYYQNNQNYNSLGNNGLIGNNYNHSDNIDGALSVIYEDENPYYNAQQQNNVMSNNFKKDDDDTLYGYVSQNDTIEDLINSQSKNKQNNRNGFFGSSSNINNNFNSSGYFGSSYMEQENMGRVYTGSSRNAGMDSYYGSNTGNGYNNHSMGSNEHYTYAGNTKQRTSSVATTDLHSSSQRKLDFDYTFEGNNSSYNKHY